MLEAFRTRCFYLSARLNSWPGPCGKAHDTTALSKWLLDFLDDGVLYENHAHSLTIIFEVVSLGGVMFSACSALRKHLRMYFTFFTSP